MGLIKNMKSKWENHKKYSDMEFEEFIESEYFVPFVIITFILMGVSLICIGYGLFNLIKLFV